MLWKDLQSCPDYQYDTQISNSTGYLPSEFGIVNLSPPHI